MDRHQREGFDEMSVNFNSKMSALLIAASLLVASCSSGDSDDAVAARIDDSLGSLSRALTVKDDASAYRLTHSRFIKRMQGARANKKTLAEQGLLHSMMWHLADMRRYRAIPEEYSVPLNTALHYVQQLYGGARAERFRRTGEPDVTAAEFEAAISRLRALAGQDEKSASPRGMAFLAGNPAVSKKEATSSGECNTMSELGEDIGAALAAAAKKIPEVGELVSVAIETFWPSNCTDPATYALQQQLAALGVQVTNATFDIYNARFNVLKDVSGTYVTTVQTSSSGQARLRDLRAALNEYQNSKDTLRATGATAAHSAAIAVPLYASYVTQYLGLLQDYINNAAVAGQCGTAPGSAKWCDPSDTDGTRNSEMCKWKKELTAITYDYDPAATTPDPVQGQLDICIDSSLNPSGSFTFRKSDSAKQFVIATMQDTGIVPAPTQSTSKTNLEMLKWNARNAWTRATTISSQDQAMYWPWMNILKYPPRPDPNDPTALLPDATIPDVVVVRELYSDIVGTIRDDEPSKSYFSWENWVNPFAGDTWAYMWPDVQPWDWNATGWLAQVVTKYQAKPHFGPIQNIKTWGQKPGCQLFCGYPSVRVFDVETIYSQVGEFKSKTISLNSVYDDTVAFNLKVGAPQQCDYRSDGKRWQSGDCALNQTHGPLFEFRARVVDDSDKATWYGIVQLGFWFIDGKSTGVVAQPTYKVDMLPYDTSADGHMYSSTPLSGDGASTTSFSLPSHIISTVFPYGLIWAGTAGQRTLDAFIVGFRPYNAWGFSN